MRIVRLFTYQLCIKYMYVWLCLDSLIPRSPLSCLDNLAHIVVMANWLLQIMTAFCRSRLMIPLPCCILGAAEINALNCRLCTAVCIGPWNSPSSITIPIKHSLNWMACQVFATQHTELQSPLKFPLQNGMPRPLYKRAILYAPASAYGFFLHLTFPIMTLATTFL